MRLGLRRGTVFEQRTPSSATPPPLARPGAAGAMTDMFFPPAGGRTFMPANTQTNLDKVAPKEGGVGSPAAASRGGGLGRESDDRLIVELREMKRQIQTSCAEEIKCQSQRMLTEIKREVHSAMGNLKLMHGEMSVDDTLASRIKVPMPGTSGGRAVSTSTPSSKDRATTASAAGQLRATATEQAKATRSSFLRPPSMGGGSSNSAPRMPAVSDPRCPLTAHGDMPPMLPFEVEQSPGPPLTEGAEDDHADAAAGGRRGHNEGGSSEKISEYQSEDQEDGEWEVLARATIGAPKRRLSLSVDACRRSKKPKKQKTLCEMSAQDFLNSSRFDNLIGGLIIMNALTIGIQTDYAASNLTEDFPEGFYIIERFFLAAFTVELCLRLYVQKCKFFCERKNMIWNYFDTTVVVVQLAEEVVTLISVNNTGTNADQFRILRILRILRIVRILRVVRVLHLISELRTIVSSIMGSFKSLGWTVILLLLMIYIVSVYFTQTISDYLIEKQANGVDFSDHDTTLQYYFGNLSRTILSLWQAMSGGADWDSMAGPLIQQVGAVTGILFAAYIAFALLALMNVVTGVFVQTALQSAKDEEDAFLVDQVLKLFDMAGDVKDKATISMGQIEDRLADPQVAAEWRSINVQPAEAQYLFSLLDIEETGEISFQEFLSGCLRLHGPAKSMDVLTVMQEARSAMRVWRMSQKRLEDYQFLYQNTIESIANSVSACSNLVARLSLNIDSAVEVANQNQDKIGRLEKRIRSFEGSLCSVRIAASNMNKVIAAELPPEMNDLIDTVISPSANGRPVAPEDNASTTVGSPAGSLPRIDEV